MRPWLWLGTGDHSVWNIVNGTGSNVNSLTVEPLQAIVSGNTVDSFELSQDLRPKSHYGSRLEMSDHKVTQITPTLDTGPYTNIIHNYSCLLYLLQLWKQSKRLVVVIIQFSSFNKFLCLYLISRPRQLKTWKPWETFKLTMNKDINSSQTSYQWPVHFK